MCALRLELGPDYILLSSNERGFSAEDVDALCNVSQSGKSVSGGDIGEKVGRVIRFLDQNLGVDERHGGAQNCGGALRWGRMIVL